MGELQIRRLTGHIGAEIRGVDLCEPDDAVIQQIHAALLEHEVVFFRETGLDDTQHLALAARFGQLSVFPLTKLMGVTEPSLQVITDGPESPPTTDYWHTDVTWTPEPPKFAFLRACVVPESGGDTLWGSMTAAYAALSPAMQAFLDGLDAMHDNESFIVGARTKLGTEKGDALGLADQLRSAYPPVMHPVVRVHPETGKKALLMGGQFMTRIVGVTELESAALLDLLSRHIDQPQLHCRWSWRLGDLAIWDERATVHRGLADHFPQQREVRRCVVDGDRPFGTRAR
jgi:taurine dioxygenase